MSATAWADGLTYVLWCAATYGFFRMFCDLIDWLRPILPRA